MGVVYAARHAILGHEIALKILHGELTQREDVVQRFFNEARAAAAIDHPGIVKVHDVGTVGDSAFLVMDLLAGESLAHRLKTRGPLPIVEVVAFARQIAGALASAHAAGIVHRDLKPDNIFLADDPGAPFGVRVVLLDFGVAKLTGSLQSGDDFKTKTGALLGTPHYMSPEQCDGERAIDHRSDLYSLGCMMFQMIGGKLPFEGGIGAVIGAHLHVPVPLLRRVLPTVPEPIEAIVARLMAKEPGARFGSAAQLVIALDAWSPHARPHDHEAPSSRPVDISALATLPIPNTPDPTIDSIAPPPSENPNSDPNRAARARPSIKPPDDEDEPRDAARRAQWSANTQDTLRDDSRDFAARRDVRKPDPPASSRRGVLVLGVVFALVGAGVLVFALNREQGGGTIRDAAVAIASDAAGDAPESHTPQIDAEIAGARSDATQADAQVVDAQVAKSPPRDAAVRDASVRDAAVVVTVPADAPPADAARIDLTTPKPKPPLTIENRLTRIANAETDFEASRDFMLLELHAPGDPRLPRAREDARKAIKAHARDEERKAIHIALIDHDWKGGLEKCRPWGADPRVDIIVQCTVFACVLEDSHLERWASGVGYRPMLEDIAAFCERFRKP